MHTQKLFVWAGSIKTFGTKKIEGLSVCKRMSRVRPPIPGKVWHFTSMKHCVSSVSGCRILIDVLLLGYFCQSMNQLDVAICRIKCHPQIENSIQLNHLAGNVSKHQLNCCMISNHTCVLQVPVSYRYFRLDHNFLDRWNTIDNKVVKFCW